MKEQAFVLICIHAVFIAMVKGACSKTGLNRWQSEGFISYSGQNNNDDCTWELHGEGGSTEKDLLILYVQAMDMHQHSCSGYLYLPETYAQCWRSAPYCRVYSTVKSKCGLDETRAVVLQAHPQCEQMVLHIMDTLPRNIRLRARSKTWKSFLLRYKFITCEAPTTARVETTQIPTTVVKATTERSTDQERTTSSNFSFSSATADEGETGADHGSKASSTSTHSTGSTELFITVALLSVLLLVACIALLALGLRYKAVAKSQGDVVVGRPDTTFAAIGDRGGQGQTSATRELVVNAIYGQHMSEQADDENSYVYAVVNKKK